MGIEVNAERAICSKCGLAYSRRKGYFPVSYAVLHKGIGHIPVCKDCVDGMYNAYLAQCDDARSAVRQVCRKLDLYWSNNVFDLVEKKSTTKSMMTQYIAKINTLTYAGKSYDNTLSEEGTLWSFRYPNSEQEIKPEYTVSENEDDAMADIPEETIAFWGSGYTADMYNVLDGKYEYYKNGLDRGDTMDIGTERLIRQICVLEATIDRDSAAGKPVEKSVNAYNTLLGSLNIKPTQKKDDPDSVSDNTPFGVWIRRWETQRPIPEVDPELEDVDGIIRYISIWFLGHLCKMLGIKNGYCRLYEEELNKMRVERPEYEDEDDETVFNDIFNSDGSGDA